MLACSGLLSACGLWSNDADGGREATSVAGTSGSSGKNDQSELGGASGSGGSLTGGEAGVSGEACIPVIAVTSQIPRLLNRQYDAVVRDLLGITALASAGNQKPSALLYDDVQGPLIAPAWSLYQDTAAKIAREVMSGPNRSKFIGCEPAEMGCVEATIKTFGRKAFRRPLTDQEVARFQKLGQTTPAPTPEELAETILNAFLVSPSFLMLPELTPASNGAANIQLSSYEVATRLSMLLWGSIPDDLLDTAADAGLLQTKEQVLTQAQRMVKLREKTAPILTAFHHYWSQMDNPNGHWWKGSHDLVQFPLYSAAVSTALQAELDAFFDNIAFGRGTFKDYFSSNVAFVNQDTAAIYGLDPARYGADLTRVELDAEQRSGFLTRAGFLSSYSSYDTSNPALRGAFILVNLLGARIGPNPDPIIDVAAGQFKTKREYLEALTSGEPCRKCHQLVDPFGYGLENYDGIGEWQTVDRGGGGIQGGGAIDATATVNLGDGLIKQISSPRQLMQELANSPAARRVYAQSWISFAFDRAPNANDVCTVDQLALNLTDNSYPVLSVLPDLTQVDSFRMRSQGQ